MRNLLLSSATLLLVPAVSMAAPGFITYTHTDTPIELKPISDISSSLKLASICFLGVGDCDPNAGFGTGDDYSMDTVQQCLDEGYGKQNCNSVQTIDGVCPYNPAYGLGCKCAPNLVSCPAGQDGVGESCGGKYVSCQCDPALVSCASNQVGQGASCGGKYESCACKPEYKYTSSNCSYPRSVSGASCGGKYTGCDCPSGVNEGQYGCDEYYPAPCSSVCKSANADNCQNREAVSTPYGCAEYWEDCPSKCKTAYNDNCRNRTEVSCQFGCASYFGDCLSKCQFCENDNCGNRTAVEAPYGCQTYWSDCSSKCQTAYPDNCHNCTDNNSQTYGCMKYYDDCATKCETPYTDNCRNRTEAISGCPANATCSYFSDCFSKISSWSCNDGYVKSGNECVVEKKGTCEDYGYSSTEPSGEKCISRWVLELSKFCYTDECKVCQLGLLCANGCAEYNRPEDMADLYNCPRVCVSCNQAPATKPDCGSQSLISCNGTYYCCDPRFASCYYTTSHNGTNGTVTYMCSVAGKVSSSVDGVVEGVTRVP